MIALVQIALPYDFLVPVDEALKTLKLEGETVEARLLDDDGHATLTNRVPDVHAWLSEHL